jgi:branched-chain amino acid transport system permease protein
MTFFVLSLLNGISYGLLLFMLSAGLTLIFSMMGVLNFAHASFYMLGAYLGYSLTGWLGFWWALLLAPCLVGAVGALCEHFLLRRVHRFGQVPELLMTFGMSYLILEVVQLVWGRSSLDFRVPLALDGPMFTLFGTQFPAYRAFMMTVSLLMLVALWLLLTRTRIGLVIQAALTHPDMVQALGHNVPRVFASVFAAGCALAGLAGVLGGAAFVTEPAMAASIGALVFVVVVIGGMGSLVGAFWASLLLGVIQTFAVASDVSLMSLAGSLGLPVADQVARDALWRLKLSQLAPVLPYLLMVLTLILRPRGLLGTRGD